MLKRIIASREFSRTKHGSRAWFAKRPHALKDKMISCYGPQELESTKKVRFGSSMARGTVRSMHSSLVPDFAATVPSQLVGHKTTIPVYGRPRTGETKKGVPSERLIEEVWRDAPVTIAYMQSQNLES